MKLIAIDLDGTLLSAGGTVSEENREALLEAQRNGCHVAICTGRSFKDTEYIVKDADLDCPIIAANGAVVNVSGEFIRNRTIPNDSAEELVSLFKDHSFHIEIYTPEGIYIHEKAEEFLKEEIHKLHEKDTNFSVERALHVIELEMTQRGKKFIASFDDLDISQLGINKILGITFDVEKRDEMNEFLKDRKDVSITNSSWCNIDIGHIETSKGRAVKDLANYFNIPLENIITIGDNYNDVSMFQVAGTSIAMGNADNEIKKQTTYTTLPFDENGVAHAIKEFVLK